MTYQDRLNDFWNITTWFCIGYFLLFVTINVVGLIWIHKTSESIKKKPIKKTIDWRRR